MSPYLRILGLGICDCKKLINGERVVTKGGLEINIGHGIFLGPSGGNGIFMGSSEGNGIFMGSSEGNGIFFRSTAIKSFANFKLL